MSEKTETNSCRAVDLDRGDIFIWQGGMYAVIRRDEDAYLAVRQIAAFWTSNPDDRWIASSQERAIEKFNGYATVTQIKFPVDWAKL